MQLQAENTSIFILAAGRGERMRPLTDHMPKPLLEVNGKSLICYHLEKIAQLGFKDVVINVAYLGQQIIDKIGNGNQYGLNIQYSNEGESGALETAGGIRNAIDLIKHPQFICINADVWTDFDYSLLIDQHNAATEKKNSLVLVKNPEHNTSGDFSFNKATTAISKLDESSKNSYTFSGISFYHKSDFAHLSTGKQPLAPLLYKWAEQGQLQGIIHTGVWLDIGTPERLEKLNQSID